MIGQDPTITPRNQPYEQQTLAGTATLVQQSLQALVRQVGEVVAALVSDPAIAIYLTLPCTAAGTNTITLTPSAGTPAVSAYSQLQTYRAIAANTTTAAVTALVVAASGNLASLKVYVDSLTGPVQAGADDIVAGNCYDFIYDSALNSSAGGFHLRNAAGTETTFTPALKFGGGNTGLTTSAATGSYSYSGRRFRFWLKIVLSAKGSSTGAATITIPIQGVSTSTSQPVSILSANMTGLTGGMKAAVDSGATTISLYQTASTGDAAISDTSFTGTSTLYICGVVEAN